MEYFITRHCLNLWRNLSITLILCIKFNAHTVNTMPFIRWRIITLSLRKRINPRMQQQPPSATNLEHMSQMPTTIRTHNLRPLHPKRAIRMSNHRARHRIEKRRPATSALEFMAGSVQWCRARRAVICPTAGRVFIVFTCECWLGAFFANDAELGGGEDCLPFFGCFLDWVRHFGRRRAGEEGADERDWHGCTERFERSG